MDKHWPTDTTPQGIVQPEVQTRFPFLRHFEFPTWVRFFSLPTFHHKFQYFVCWNFIHNRAGEKLTLVVHTLYVMFRCTLLIAISFYLHMLVCLRNDDFNLFFLPSCLSTPVHVVNYCISFTLFVLQQWKNLAYFFTQYEMMIIFHLFVLGPLAEKCILKPLLLKGSFLCTTIQSLCNFVVSMQCAKGI